MGQCLGPTQAGRFLGSFIWQPRELLQGLKPIPTCSGQKWMDESLGAFTQSRREGPGRGPHLPFLSLLPGEVLPPDLVQSSP